MFSKAFETLRVTPAAAPGRTVFVGVAGEEQAADLSDGPDGSAPWSCQIAYLDAAGARSERRITCRRVSGYGAPTDILAFCHERNAPRRFKIERIVEMVDIVTGEFLDPYSHFEMLRQTGYLPETDDGLTAFLEIVTFMARCDGELHPLEAEAVEDAITAYCLRFETSDRLAEAALTSHNRLAPNGSDVIRAVKRLNRSAIGTRAARLILDHCGRIMDADGIHHADEIAWAVEIGDALKSATKS